MLRKKMGGVARGPRLSSAVSELTQSTVNRRDFIRKSGLAVGGLATASALTGTTVKSAKAQTMNKTDVIQSVCTHCSVGCTVLAEVQDGVWVGQEPAFDSPDRKSVV